MDQLRDPVPAHLNALRRNQILDAAATIFATRGFHVTTIADIARAAGIANGTIYLYFKSKGELLLGLLDRMTEHVRRDAHLPDPTDGDVRGFLKAYISYPLLALTSANSELFRVLLSEALVNDELRILFAARIAQPLVTSTEPAFRRWAEDALHADVNIPLTMQAISSMLLGVILKRIIGDPILEAQWDDLPDLLTDLILSGLQKEHP